MPAQVEEAEKNRRSGVLQAIAQRASKDFRSYYIGREVEVLLEEEKVIAGQAYWLGHTREYVKAAVSARGKSLENQLIVGTVKGFLEDDIIIMEY